MEGASKGSPYREKLFEAITDFVIDQRNPTESHPGKEEAERDLLIAQRHKVEEDTTNRRVDCITCALQSGCELPEDMKALLRQELMELLVKKK